MDLDVLILCLILTNLRGFGCDTGRSLGDTNYRLLLLLLRLVVTGSGTLYDGLLNDDLRSGLGLLRRDLEGRALLLLCN